LPARIQLEKFEAEAYGGLEATIAPMLRDFRSTINITNPATGQQSTQTVYLNNPVFYNDGQWIFFQSGWDNQNQQFTVLGIGNRPGVTAMQAGCVIILTGILYAFYVKPLIISSRKRRAIAEAQASKAAKIPQPVLVEA
jgi:cytochrome c biogenesis protein ResB